MSKPSSAEEMIAPLNQALVRELTVCLKYMLEHAIGSADMPKPRDKTPIAQRSRFMGSYSNPSLKRIAIAEMRHAERIAKRITALGGTPVTAPDPYALPGSAEEMLAANQALERGAIALYREIVQAAEAAGDADTATLFADIIEDEEEHLATFQAMQAL